MTAAALSLPEALRALLPAPLQALCAPAPLVRGATLFMQGKRPTRMLYVASGEVVLQRTGIRGDALVLQRTRHGFVAEASLLSARYHCDAFVTRPGIAITIPIEQVKKALADDPRFAARWIEMLNQEVRRLRGQCERLSMKGVSSRLLHLIETEGKDGRLPLGAGLKSIASELGVSHEALYRTIAALEKARLLRRDGTYLLMEPAA